MRLTDVFLFLPALPLVVWAWRDRRRFRSDVNVAREVFDAQVDACARGDRICSVVADVGEEVAGAVVFEFPDRRSA